MHIPDDPSYYEKFYFTPGDLGFRNWPTQHGNIGVCVCWDQWYPEAARLTALRGAEILFYPTAIGWHPSEKAKYGYAQHSAWETMQRSHAIANGCFVAAVNRVGHEAPAGGDGIEFWGQSFIVAPSGEILAQGECRSRRNDFRRRGMEAGERTPHPLAFPARPPDRRLRRSRATPPRLTMKGRAIAVLWSLVGAITVMAQPSPTAMNPIAERYVKLVLAMTPYDSDYVDAYYGPPAWKTEVEAAKPSLADIAHGVADLRAELKASASAGRDRACAPRIPRKATRRSRRARPAFTG